ncbi:MAG: c-type cytochrome [Candidatus Eremiobacteraeota bacterium]|nr:c-type cytochrome [Candidatus Eremiobacteraeota bacterium]
MARILGALCTSSMLLAVLPACATQGHKTAEQVASRAAVLRVNPASANDGARVYIKNCSSCHQLDGAGVAGAFPPLADNPQVVGNPHDVISVVKLGTRGKLVVAGINYNGTMPAWGQMISDTDIAAVVTYIRTAWRNRATPVTLADVEAVSQ